MNSIHERAIRTLIAMQVAILEHIEESIEENKAIKAIEQINREWQKIIKELGKM